MCCEERLLGLVTRGALKSEYLMYLGNNPKPGRLRVTRAVFIVTFRLLGLERGNSNKNERPAY